MMELHRRLSICGLDSLDRPFVLQIKNARFSYKYNVRLSVYQSLT